jgi:hypothetical protein
MCADFKLDGFGVYLNFPADVKHYTLPEYFAITIKTEVFDEDNQLSLIRSYITFNGFDKIRPVLCFDNSCISDTQSFAAKPIC